VGPLLLLSLVALFAWWGFGEAIQQSGAALARGALESNRFAAKFVARTAAHELDARWRTIEQLADSAALRQALREIAADSEVRKLLTEVSNPQATTLELEQWQHRFREHPKRLKLQEQLRTLIAARPRPEVSGWFLTDAQGVQLAHVPGDSEIPTVGRNFSWRSYFHGQAKDRPDTWRAGPTQHVTDTTLSAVYQSRGSNRWTVAITAPVVDTAARDEFLGVIGLTLEMGQILEFHGGPLEGSDNQFPVLVDWRDGEHKGVILRHPLFDQLVGQQGSVPGRFKDYRLAPADLPNQPARMEHFHDPLSDDPDGKAYDKQWLAQMEPVVLHGQETGWIVIVEEAYDRAIGEPLKELQAELLRFGLGTAAMMLLVVAGLWAMAIRLLNQSTPAQRVTALAGAAQPGSGLSGSGDSSGQPGVTPAGPTPTV
jgi:hypothetical protein